MNPGSLGYGGTYGIVDITPAGVVTSLVPNRDDRQAGGAR